MIFLPSCGKKVKKESVTPLRPNGIVSASYNDTDYSARINYAETGVMSVEMLSPIKGIAISVDDSGCRLGYDGMEIDCTTERTESLCPVIRLFGAENRVLYRARIGKNERRKLHSEISHSGNRMYGDIG